MIDTDNFKSINDTFGHAYGDEIIKYVATSIDSNFRSTDYKARMGGDEFMVFMQNTNKASVEARAKMLNDKIRRDCTQDGKTVQITENCLQLQTRHFIRPRKQGRIALEQHNYYGG